MRIRSLTSCLVAALGLACATPVLAQSRAQIAQAEALGFARVSAGRDQQVDFVSGASTLRARSGADAAALMRGPLGTLLGFGPDHAARVVAERSAGATRYFRLQQLHLGVPVFGGELAVQAKADGTVEAVLGRARATGGGVTPQLGAGPALERALQQFVQRDGQGASLRVVPGVPAGYRIVRPATLAVHALGTPRLAWDATIEFHIGERRFIERLFADATTGELVASYTQIHTALSRNIHDLQNGCIAAFGGATLPGPLVLSEGGTTADTVVKSAYDHSGTVYWYYRNAFNRDAIRNDGAPLKSSVRVTFGQFFASNCTGANAAWIDTEKLMVFGTGDTNNFHDLTRGGDVAYHEMTHGVTSAESNLVYQKESGGINEAMSDIFAAAAEAWLLDLQRQGLAPGATAPVGYTIQPRVWLVGEDVVKPTFGRAALRFMDDPEADNYSVDHYADYQTKWGDACSPSTNNDQCGVHGSSGIPNLAFKLMVTGGTHPRGQTTVQVPAIGMAAAIRTFYDANTNLLSSNATFQDLRNATVQSATNIWGANSCQRNAITLAWNAVGVPGDTAANPGACGGANQAPTASFAFTTSGLTASFTDGSSDPDGSIASRSWAFGDGTTSTAANPSKTYAAAGTYNVTLTVTDNAGASASTTRAVTVASTANQAPTASFGFVTSGLTATFTDGSSDPDGSIASRSWAFGDGTTSTATNPSKTYAAAGTYTVTLTVTDNQGATATTTRSVTVSSSNVLQNGVAVTGLAAATGAELDYTMVVPAGAANLKFEMSGGTGDADLYVRFGSAPTTSTYDCRPYKTGNAETCTFAAPQAGTYHVKVRAYAAFSGVTLKGSYGVAGPRFENLTDFAISDNATIESPITVSGVAGNAPSGLQVAVTIYHTYQGDLKVDLVAPDGTLYNMHNRTGAGTDNLIRTYTVNASAEVANGTWKLRVLDAAAGDVGRLDKWSLQF